MVPNDFAVFVLSHGRANHMLTLKTLTKCGYTGKWYIIIDNEDNQADDYYSLFGKDHVVMFDKAKKALEVDTCDMTTNRKAVIYARNSCFEIAQQLGLSTFLELDDDYTEFRMRYLEDGVLKSIYVQDMDSIINEVIEFLYCADIDCVAFSQTGDFIGGAGCKVYQERLTRKLMNSFFCRVDKPFYFIGKINEDTNTYVLEGSRGKVFFTIADICLNQEQTQANYGGLTDIYLELGTYVKSFYTVMTSPSCAKVAEVGVSHKRIHHWVNWNVAVPMIISDKFKK